MDHTAQGAKNGAPRCRREYGQQEQRKWKVCGEAADGREAIDKHAALKPHVIVMDFKMPRLDGLQAARRILKDNPSARILMVSVSAPRQLMEEVKKVVIKGFCPKSRMDALLVAVEAILRGETYFPEEELEE